MLAARELASTWLDKLGTREVPRAHTHRSMNRLYMTIIDCVSCRGPQEACYELRVCTCVRSAGYSRFALLPMHCINFAQNQ